MATMMGLGGEHHERHTGCWSGRMKATICPVVPTFSSVLPMLACPFAFHQRMPLFRFWCHVSDLPDPRVLSQIPLVYKRPSWAYSVVVAADYSTIAFHLLSTGQL